MATLILEDGARFEGELFGRKAEVTGEVVFTTGMTGYQETLTDPSYCGQIVCMTYPLIGNVGINELDTTTAKYYNLPAGVYVASVTEGSCAEAAGVRQGDIITALGDQTVESYTDLASALRDHKAGETVTLTVYRSGQMVDLSVTLDEKQPEPTEETTDSTTQNEEPTQEDSPTYGELNPFDYFFGGN